MSAQTVFFTLPAVRANVTKRAQAKRSAVCRAADKESVKAEDLKRPVVCGDASKEADEHQGAACTEMAKSKCVHPERSSGFCKDCPRKK